MTEEIPSFMWCISGNKIPPVPCVRRRCGDCGGAIWVSRTMVPLADAGELQALCPACSAVRFADADDGVEFKIHSAQTDELAGLGLLGEADWWITNLNRAGRAKGRDRRG